MCMTLEFRYRSSQRSLGVLQTEVCLAEKSPKRDSEIERLLSLMRRRGLIRSRDLTSVDVERKTLMRGCQKGAIERVGRGMYSLPGRNRDQIAEACLRVPHSVVCLSSALYFHDLIASKPQEIFMSIVPKSRLPRVDCLPLKIVRFSGDALTQGVVNSKIGGVPIRVYSPMKTIADCYKFRNKLGAEVARAALRASVETGSYSRYRLLHFARICRVEKLLDWPNITN